MSENKKFNPKIGNAFENSAFGEGSVLCHVDAEGLDAIMKNLRVGGSILFKFNKKTMKGNNHYFAEILPPYNPNNKTTGGKKETKTALD